MIPITWGAGRDSDDASQRFTYAAHAHANLDERRPVLLKLLDDQPLSRTGVHRQEDEAHVPQFIHVRRINLDWVSNDAPTKGVVLLLEILDLGWRGVEFFQARGPRSAKGVVREEPIRVEEMYFLNRCLGD